MDQGIKLFGAIFISIMASSGFWAWLGKHDRKKSANTRLLMGMAYRDILDLGLKYIERGWITQDEFEELHKYLYIPYKEFGGNGVAEKLMKEVQHLPFRRVGQGVELEITQAKERGAAND